MGMYFLHQSLINLLLLLLEHYFIEYFTRLPYKLDGLSLFVIYWRYDESTNFQNTPLANPPFGSHTFWTNNAIDKFLFDLYRSNDWKIYIMFAFLLSQSAIQISKVLEKDFERVNNNVVGMK